MHSFLGLGLVLLIPAGDCLVTSKMPLHHSLHQLYPRRSIAPPIGRITTLHLSSYNEDSTTELLEALLSQAHITAPQREYSYQRRRLGEQLRLNKRSLGESQYSYQRRRLGEQLRLNKQNCSRLFMGTRDEEMFQRARLKDQLRFQKSQVARINDEKSKQPSVQLGEAGDNSNELNERLEHLRHEIEIAVRPPVANTTGLAIYDATKDTSLLKMLQNTHLPLPPREDASILSLLFAPLAHLVSSAFLIGAMMFCAFMALLDVLLNDKKTKTCITETGHVWKSCFAQFSSSFTTNRRDQVLSTMTEASKTFLISFWYIAKCICIRATYSKYANDCLDAGTGALRYGVYAIRSINVIWQRVLCRIKGTSYQRDAFFTSKQVATKSKSPLQTQKRKFHLSRLLSSFKEAKAKRLHRKQTLQIEQQRTRLEAEYQAKLRALNQDRILLEREKRALEEERSELICESMSLIAWCAAVGAGNSSNTMSGEKQKQKGWSLGGWWKAWD